MGAPRLRIDSDDCALRLWGELELATATDLVDRVRAELHGGSDPLRLDLDGIAFMDSSGLAALIRCRRLARAAGRDVVLVCSPDSPSGQLLALSALDAVFVIEPA